MKEFLFIYSLFSIFFVKAQELEAQSTVGNVISMNDIFTKHLKVSGKEEITGNPFLFSNWDNVGVVYSETRSYSYKKLNYNIFSDDIGILKSKDSVLIFSKVKIDSFIVKNKKFRKYHNRFYEVLYQGSKISLLKKYEVQIVEGMFNPIDGTKEKSRFKTTDDYYIENSIGIVEFVPSKKTISSIFEDETVMVRKFIKQKKLSLKKEKDLIEIFKYYNQL
jgi:hypothetical protein